MLLKMRVTGQSREVRAVLGFSMAAALLVLGATAATARSFGDYYPLAIGNSWTYEIVGRSEISFGGRTLQSDVEGRLEQVAVALSPFSAPGAPAYKVLGRLQLRGTFIAPLVRVEALAHISTSRFAIRCHEVDYLSVDIPGGEAGTSTGGDLELEVLAALQGMKAIEERYTEKARSTERVTVPSGSYRKALRVVIEGSWHGNIGEMEIRDSKVHTITWLVRGVGVVRQETSLRLSLASPNGAASLFTQESTKQLLSYELAD